MKTSLALGSRERLSRQTAWGCLTSNLALPGSGSLVAGRRSGYGQLALGAAGLVLTSIFGLRFIFWSVKNWSHLYGAQADPMNAFNEMWPVLKWALLGLGVFAIGWLWGLATGLQIIYCAKVPEPGNVPPRLG
jgi:hypothetical protein